MKNPTYPKIKRAEKLSCKLSDLQIKKIKLLYKNGSSMRHLGKMFSVAPITIKYWVNAEYRENDKKRVMKKVKNLRKDPKIKKVLNRKRADSIKNARERIESLNKYHKKEISILNKKVTANRRTAKLNKK